MARLRVTDALTAGSVQVNSGVSSTEFEEEVWIPVRLFGYIFTQV